MLDERLVGIVAEMCEDLLETCDALAVSLVDERLREIAHAGAELPAELELPRPAQELVQHVGKHQVFTIPVAIGSRGLAGRGLLVVMFGNTSSLGLVRVRARNVSREIEEIVAGAIPPDDGGPSGAAAAAVAWPPARRKRGRC